MNNHVKSIAEKAKKLPAFERAELVDELLASLVETDPEIDQLWSDEAEKRLDEYRKGKINAIDARDVISELRRR